MSTVNYSDRRRSKTIPVTNPTEAVTHVRYVLWFSYGDDGLRGYNLAAMPVQHSNGFEITMAFSGCKIILEKTVGKFSQKKLNAHWEELHTNPCILNELIAKVCESTKTGGVIKE
jgi:hypothetical protein